MGATKLSLLLFIAILTSHISFMLNLFIPLMSGVIFSVDNLINVYCLWLSFKINDKVYKKYFCGDGWTILCFPIIKSVAICCYEERNCHCCCCCVCCTCDQIKRQRHKQRYL